MTTQSQRAETFTSLHKKGDPVILFNIWDAGSAGAVRDAGAQAIATGSAPVAMARGYSDGQDFPIEAALDNVRRIVKAVDLPVTLDFESGYAVDPEAISDNVARALDCGVVGFNFEDQIIGGDGLYPFADQAARVEAVRKACDGAGIPAYINARTDIFLKAPAETHDAAMLNDAIARAAAYQSAGASGFFAPGLKDEAMIGQLCAATDLPVNIIALPGTPDTPRLAELGVARVSYGPVPYRQMIAWLTEQARAAINYG